MHISLHWIVANTLFFFLLAEAKMLAFGIVLALAATASAGKQRKLHLDWRHGLFHTISKLDFQMRHKLTESFRSCRFLCFLEKNPHTWFENKFISVLDSFQSHVTWRFFERFILKILWLSTSEFSINLFAHNVISRRPQFEWDFSLFTLSI